VVKPNFVKIDDNNLDYNFRELTKLFLQMSDIANAKPIISVSLVTGDNQITPTVTNPQGRVIVFQDAAATLFDKGLVKGNWVINASAPCNIKLTFF
jgi:hypothetical protein